MYVKGACIDGSSPVPVATVVNLPLLKRQDYFFILVASEGLYYSLHIFHAFTMITSYIICTLTYLYIDRVRLKHQT